MTVLMGTFLVRGREMAICGASRVGDHYGENLGFLWFFFIHDKTNRTSIAVNEATVNMFSVFGDSMLSCHMTLKGEYKWNGLNWFEYM